MRKGLGTAVLVGKNFSKRFRNAIQEISAAADAIANTAKRMLR